MATQVQGLFGLNPEEIQAQQDALLQERARQFAQMDPMERANYGIFMGVNQLGSGIAQAMGYESPEMKAAKERQGLLSGMDITNPQALRDAAQKAWNGGQHSIAQALLKQANEYETEQATVLKTRAEATAKMRDALTNEAKNAQSYADLIAERGTPEWSTAYSKRLKYLTDKTGSVKEIGVAAGSGSPVYYDQNQDMQYIMQTDATTGKQVRVPYSGSVDRTTSKTSVNVNANRLEESEFLKQLGKVQANRLGDAYDKREAAIRELKTYEQLNNLGNSPLITGTGAPVRIEVANFMNTLGLASKADAAKLANSQQFEKLSGDLVLSRVKQLGYNPSDADRAFIDKTIPRLGVDPAARKALVEFMAKAAKSVVTEVSSMEEHAIKNKTLTGYVPKVPEVSFGGSAANKGVSEMSDQELLDALNKKGKR